MKKLLFTILLIGLSSTFTIAHAQTGNKLEHLIDSLLTVCDRSPNFNEAMQAGLAARDSVSAQIGKGNMLYARSVAAIGTLNRKNGRFKDAESFLLEAKDLFEQLNNQESKEYGTILSHLGVVNAVADRNAQAETYMISAKDLFEKITGKVSADYANSTYNLALFYYNTSKYDLAEPLFQEAVDIQNKVAGKENMYYALYLNGFANLYIGIGQYERAEPLSLEAKEIRARVLGKDHTDYILSLASLGNLYRLSGQYKKAEIFYREVIEQREKKPGKNHPDYATALNNLGTLYTQAGQFDQAEPLMLEAIKIREEKLGKTSQGYATSANLLAALYQYTGQYDKSEQLFLEVIAIREKLLGKEHSTYALSLNNLATLYLETGAYEKALPLCLESKATREKAFGKENPDYAASVMNLANVYKNMGKSAEAEALYLEAIDIGKRVWGEKHPSLAEIFSNLANLYTSNGQFDQAAPLYLACKQIQEETMGNQNPQYAKNLGAYARMLFTSGQTDEAVAFEKEFISRQHQILIQSTKYMSEQELSAYTKVFSNTLSNDLSYAQFASDHEGLIAEICYDNALFFKGFLLSATNQLKKLAQSNDQSSSQYELLGAYRRRLAAEYAKPLKDQKNVAELDAKANTVEKELARSLAGYDDAQRQIRWQDVQAQLKPGEVAVEFVHYRVTAPKPQDSTMYAALVLQPNNARPKFIPLFEEKQLSPLLRGAAGGQNYRIIDALYSTKAKDPNQENLYDLIWQPLESLLAGSQVVYCAPSGLLHRINLAAISNQEGLVFGEKQPLVVMGSTRQLVFSNKPKEQNKQGAYLAGGIRYDNDPSGKLLVNRSTVQRSSHESLSFKPDSLSQTRGEKFSYLPGTAIEVKAIGDALQTAGFKVTVDTGLLAAEDAFRQLGEGALTPQIIHLATHGYFFQDIRNKKQLSSISQEPVFKTSEHPMIRSGLILAGGNEAWLTGKYPEGSEDGILTAYEISQMSLLNTELVVLSACETGLGDIIGNEGVYGLQRAFKIAGARYLIMSLWKVEDEATKAFMTTFYQQWLTKRLTIPEAFQQTRQIIKSQYKEAHIWAGFILIE